jgi:hypothetical protein
MWCLQVKDVGPYGVIVEPQALLVATSSPQQLVSWCNFIVMYVFIFFSLFAFNLIGGFVKIRLVTEPARSPSPPHPITLLSGVPVNFERLTPELKGSQRGRS